VLRGALITSPDAIDDAARQRLGWLLKRHVSV
jgi:hypothetical protein